jgi:hypothetical protein
LLRSDL